MSETSQNNRKHQKDKKGVKKNVSRRKGFTYSSAKRSARAQTRALDIATKRHHVPVEKCISDLEPPILVCVAGPPKVGKSTLISSLIKRYNKQQISNIKGPLTIVTGKSQRMTLFECNNDINSMIDMAKIADIVVVMIDATFGFELESFEMISILQAHGFPKVVGVLNHLDLLRTSKKISKYVHKLKQTLWKETYEGAKLYTIKKFMNGVYGKNDMLVLSRYLSKSKSVPPSWHTTHSFVLVDRIEDVTEPELIRSNPDIERNMTLYGYVRGCNFRHDKVHIAGYGDVKVKNISMMSDPCIPPTTINRSLVECERVVYGPFSGVGNLIYDKDAVYINVATKKNEENGITEKNLRLNALKSVNHTFESKLTHAPIQIFQTGPLIYDDEIEMDGESKDYSKCESIETVQTNVDIGECSNLIQNNDTFFQSSPHILLYRKIYGTDNTANMRNVEIERDEDGIFCPKDTVSNEHAYSDNSKNCSWFVDGDYGRIKDLTLDEAYEKRLRECFSGRTSDEIVEENDVEEEKVEAGDKKSKVKQSKIEMERNVAIDEKHLIKLKEDIGRKVEEKNREFENLNEDERVVYEGYQIGRYVRIEVESISNEFMKNFDPTYPLLLGCVLAGEDDECELKMRVKRHKNYDRLLKSGDPVIVSSGWRRFQTRMIYAMEDHNKRIRYIKYTPQGLHCIGVCFGPVSQSGFGIVAFQNVCADSKTGFRIALTGVMLESGKNIPVVRKQQLTGYPHEIHHKTAFIKGMFSSALEVTRFEGAIIKTVSGIRGHIKRHTNGNTGGMFRATFEDKILMSDVIMLRTWVPYQLEPTYFLVKNLLLPIEQKTQWEGQISTAAQQRQQSNVVVAKNQESIYKPIERKQAKFAPITIPSKLVKQMPFKSKPKLTPKSNKNLMGMNMISPVEKISIENDREKEAIRFLNEMSTVNKQLVTDQICRRKRANEKYACEKAKRQHEFERKNKSVRKSYFKKLAMSSNRMS